MINWDLVWLTIGLFIYLWMFYELTVLAWMYLATYRFSKSNSVKALFLVTFSLAGIVAISIGFGLFRLISEDFYLTIRDAITRILILLTASVPGTVRYLRKNIENGSS